MGDQPGSLSICVVSSSPTFRFTFPRARRFPDLSFGCASRDTIFTDA